MNHSDPRTAAEIDAMRSRLAGEVAERLLRRRPELAKRYGRRGRTKSRQDAELHLRYLAQAMELGLPELFGEYLSWAAAMLKSRGIRPDDLRADVVELQQMLCEEFPAAAPGLRSVVDPAIQRIGSAEIEQTVSVPETAQRYLNAALGKGPVEASRVVDELVASGLPVKRIYVDVLQPALYEAGRLWQENRISEADEHYCTAVTQRILAKLFSDFSQGTARGPLIVVACVHGELHELGARMVCDLLALENYKTHYLGASMPAAAIVDYACMHQARVLALSASITPHLGEMRQAIQRVRTDPRCPELQVVVGGRVFNLIPTLWRVVGADAWAPDAAMAVDEIKRLLSPASASWA